MNALAIAVLVSLAGAPSPSKKTQLKVEVNPSSAVVFVDGKRKGSGGKVLTLNVEPGRHNLKVVNKGDEHQEQVSVKKGEVKVWKWAFEDDRLDKKEAAAGGSASEGTEGQPPDDEGPMEAAPSE